MDSVREAESVTSKAPKIARIDASRQARGIAFRIYAVGGAREMLRDTSGPLMRTVPNGKNVVPTATGAET